MNIKIALEKLNKLLPLKERQEKLSPEQLQAHHAILNSFSISGNAPNDIEESILNTLSENDLVVLDKEGQITGAYPFSLRKTEHHVFNENISIYAMCAFDAIAIAPIFNIKINIISACHLSREKIEIIQDGNNVVNVKPTKDVYIGIRWQSAGSCAADSLCMEMVFLKNKNTSIQWKGSDTNLSVFSLNDAIKFSVKYFKPLLGTQ